MKTLILFAILESVSPRHADIIRSAFLRWQVYQAFEVRESSDPLAVQVAWTYIDGPGGTMAETRGTVLGHNENSITFDRDELWTPDTLLWVAMHEIGHLVFGNNYGRPGVRHGTGDSLMGPWVRSDIPARLTLDDIKILSKQYGSIRVIPQRSKGAFRP